MSGDDWIFVCRKVHELSPKELEVFIEYHRQYLGLLQNEQACQKAAKAHTQPAVKLMSEAGSSLNGSTTRVETTETTTKKTSTTKISKKAEQAKALLQSMLAQGFSLDDILKQS